MQIFYLSSRTPYCLDLLRMTECDEVLLMLKKLFALSMAVLCGKHSMCV